MSDSEVPANTAHAIAHLDDVVHHRSRLAILVLLGRSTECEFTFLRERLELSDGNLGAHLKVLAGAGLIEMTRRAGFSRTRTWVRISNRGRTALAAELNALAWAIDGAPGVAKTTEL